MERGFGRFKQRLSRRLLLVERLVAFVFAPPQIEHDFGLPHLRFGHLEIGLRLVDALFVFDILDFRNDRTAGDAVADIEMDRLEPAADLRRDFEDRPRTQRSGEGAAVLNRGMFRKDGFDCDCGRAFRPGAGFVL